MSMSMSAPFALATSAPFQKNPLGPARLQPEISLGARDGVFLAVIHTDQSTPQARGLRDRHKPARPAHKMGPRWELQSHVPLHYLLCLGQIRPQDWIPCEQCLEHVRDLELRPGRRPFLVLSMLNLRDIYGIVHETELLVRALVLEGISVLFAEREHHVND